jgi:membrane protease subunit (stomatin/prohibitin family)
MVRQVVRSLQEDGRDTLSPGVMIWRDHNVDIQNRSILIVESNEKCVVRTQGLITDVYGAGSTNLNSPNSGVYSTFKRLNYGG